MKKILALIMSLAMILSLAACGGTETPAATEAPAAPAATETPAEPAPAATETPVEKKDITIAISSHYAPFCYLDENEKPAGYEYDLFMMVGEKLADKYNVEVVCDGFGNLFVGLESGKYDVISHHLAYNAERAEKYNVSAESLMFYGNMRILHKADRTELVDLDSLQGMTLANGMDDNAGKMLVAYNEEHPENPIKLQETYPNAEAIVAGIDSGLYDGYVFSSFDLQTKYIDLYPDVDLVMSEKDLIEGEFDCGTYALYEKGNDELQADVDAAIKALRDEGKIAELCIEWFGGDYSVEP